MKLIYAILLLLVQSLIGFLLGLIINALVFPSVNIEDTFTHVSQMLERFDFGSTFIFTHFALIANIIFLFFFFKKGLNSLVREVSFFKKSTKLLMQIGFLFSVGIFILFLSGYIPFVRKSYNSSYMFIRYYGQYLRYLGLYTFYFIFSFFIANIVILGIVSFFVRKKEGINAK